MVIKNCRVFDGEHFLEGLLHIHMEGQRIVDVTAEVPPEGDEILDAQGHTACPGLVDIHTHGMGDHDFSDAGSDMEAIFRSYAEKGTTSLMPALITDSLESMRVRIGSFFSTHPSFLGVHLEGPFLNPEKRGAHPAMHVRTPSIEDYIEMTAGLEDRVKRITIAPEKDEGFALSKYARERDVLLSFGHTLCGAETAREAFDCGYRLATHTFNAMPSLHHREPSITGCALIDDRIFCEIIPDLIHVHPDMLELLFRVKGPGKVVSISDSIPLGPGTTLENGRAINREGTLAGSMTTLHEGILNLLGLGMDPETVLRSATANPVDALGTGRKIGRIRKGHDADILVLDRDYLIHNIILKGERIK
ncbi:MAG: N-acetylglucosamine-6-phosphate deacetylase [Clostridia bacterium]